MSTQHTPGPWSYFYKPKYDEWHVSLPMAGSSMKLALAPDGIQSANREADARLIASAPELLAALKAIVDQLDHEDTGEPGLAARDWIAHWQTLHDNAAAAVTKATTP